MTSKVLSINPENTLEEAIDLMAQNNISGLPVTDEEKKIVGVLSESDIIDYSSKLQVVTRIGSSGWISPYTDVNSLTSFKKGYEILSRTKVKEVMTKKVVTVFDTDSAEEVARLMSKKNINRVPVVNYNGALVGIITRSNLLLLLAEDN